MAQKLTVCVLFGGQSTEHEVSRMSAASVIQNLDKDKYDVATMGITKEGKWYLFQGPVEKIISGEWENGNVTRAIISPDNTMHGMIVFREGETANARIDVVFPVLHGLYGEDGTIQGLLELAGLNYVGAGVLASSVGMDKVYTKLVFKEAGIPQADWEVVFSHKLDYDCEKICDKIEQKFSYPCFIKPSNSGSSVGISKAHNRQELVEGLKEAAKYDDKILVEEFIDGKEVECSVLGNEDAKASVAGEIIPSNEFYDYDAKYNDENSKLIIPAKISEKTSNEIRQYAVKAFKMLGCKGLTRVDFFINKDGKVILNEVNTMPGFTNISMYPKLWEASGIKYSKLLDKLIELAMEKDSKNQS